MKDVLIYIFWPNPPTPSYSDPKVALLIALCVALVAGSFALKIWRKNVVNPVTRRLTKSYPAALLTFGLVGLFLLVCRVEGISYLSMRLWWGVWLVCVGVFAFIQFKLFKARHYEIIPQGPTPKDPKQKYLPRKKKR